MDSKKFESIFDPDGRLNALTQQGYEALVIGPMMGSLDLIPGGSYFARHPGMREVVKQSLLRSVAKRGASAVMAGAKEAPVEILQEVIGDLGALGFREEALELGKVGEKLYGNWENYAAAGTLGFAVGTTVGGVSQAVSNEGGDGIGRPPVREKGEVLGGEQDRVVRDEGKDSPESASVESSSSLDKTLLMSEENRSEGLEVEGSSEKMDSVNHNESDPELEEAFQTLANPPKTVEGDVPETHAINTPEREALRSRIVEEAVANVPIQDEPVIYFMAGGGGAGKSTLIKTLSNNRAFPESYVNINADDVKAKLPEYNELIAKGDGRAARVAHVESANIADEIFRKSLANKQDILFDGTMSQYKWSVPLIKQAKKAGYRVVIHGVTVNPKTAIKRVAKRAKQSGRYVPGAIVTAAHQDFANNIEKYAPMVDEWYLHDNNGVVPKVIAHKKDNLI